MLGKYIISIMVGTVIMQISGSTLDNNIRRLRRPVYHKLRGNPGLRKFDPDNFDSLAMFQLQSKKSTPDGNTRCMNVMSNSVEDNGLILIWDCDNSANNKFLVAFTGDYIQDGGRDVATFQLVGGVSRKCVEDYGAITSSGTAIDQYDCAEGAKHQLWYIRWLKNDLTTGYFSIVGVGSGKCLDVDGGYTEDSTRLVLYTCGESDNQLWKFIV